MAVPQHVTARDQAIVLLTKLCERFEPRSDWRHTDVAEVVDALIDAARAPESAHTRALADERTGLTPEDERRRVKRLTEDGI